MCLGRWAGAMNNKDARWNMSSPNNPTALFSAFHPFSLLLSIRVSLDPLSPESMPLDPGALDGGFPFDMSNFRNGVLQWRLSFHVPCRS